MAMFNSELFVYQRVTMVNARYHVRIDATVITRSTKKYLVRFKNDCSYGHLPVITGYKWDYTFYKWGYKYL